MADVLPVAGLLGCSRASTPVLASAAENNARSIILIQLKCMMMNPMYAFGYGV